MRIKIRQLNSNGGMEVKKDIIKVKPKQLTEQRVREIAREEANKMLSDYCKVISQIHQTSKPNLLKNMGDL
jgi:hypothetical protein